MPKSPKARRVPPLAAPVRLGWCCLRCLIRRGINIGSALLRGLGGGGRLHRVATCRGLGHGGGATVAVGASRAGAAAGTLGGSGTGGTVAAAATGDASAGRGL